MPKCIFLVGMPASGKSTWVRANWPPRTMILSTDEIIEKLATPYGLTYNEAFKNLIGFAEQVFFKKLHDMGSGNFVDAEGEKFDIVIDRTNLSVKSRKRIMDVLKPHGYTFEAIAFTTPEHSEWMRRLSTRPGKNIPWDVLVDMAKRYEEPTMAEGFDKIDYDQLPRKE